MSDQASAGLRDEVRTRYAEAARAVLGPEAGVTASCCGSSAADSCCGAGPAEAVGGFSEGLYREGETDGLPEEAVLASLGCGNPLAVADLHEGERVLDLGSGGGIDVLLSARRVGPAGFAYGVDMTDEMLTLARANAAKAGTANVEFVKGEIEALPLPDQAVDVVISNCVINLSTDKPAVLAEMFRVLIPGGRIGITDVVAEDHLSAADRAAAGSYVGCIAGALSRAEYLDGLAAAGFADASVTFTHEAAPGMHSAIIRAVKPAATLQVPSGRSCWPGSPAPPARLGRASPGLQVPPRAWRTAARRPGTIRHQVHLPRLSPSMSPARARTPVWWEMVGWLLPSGCSRLQLHTSPCAATRDISRSRTGSASAASTAARAAASASDSGTSVIGGPHKASPTVTSGIVRVPRPAAITPPIDNNQCDPDTGHIDSAQSTGRP